MSLFFLRHKLKSILAVVQENQKEIKKMSTSIDNLNAAVTAAVNQLGALSQEVAALKAEIAANGGDAAAEQAAADALNAAVAANPI